MGGMLHLCNIIYKPLTSVVKRRKQNHKISFHFFATPPCTPRRFFERKEIFGFGLRPEGARGAHCSLHHAIRAYDSISSHHARGACEDQSLCDWKKVRAKVNISAPTLSSVPYPSTAFSRKLFLFAPFLTIHLYF